MGKRVTFEQAQQRLIDVGQHLQLIEFTKVTKSCKVKCLECGEEFSVSVFNNLIYVGKSGNLNRRCRCQWTFTIEQAQKQLDDLNQNLRLVKFTNTHGPCVVKCIDCGKQFTVSVFQSLTTLLYNGNPRTRCECKTNKTREPANTYPDRVKTRGFIALEEYKKIDIPILHKCIECKTEFMASPHKILSGNTGCPHCRRSTSIGEKFVADWLSSHDIKFIREYRMQINNRLHKMDFYLPDRNMIIEYDGQQHFMPVDFGGWGEDIAYEKFLDRQSQDRDKNKYCFDNHIKLLRIKYDMPFEKAAEVLMNILI